MIDSRTVLMAAASGLGLSDPAALHPGTVSSADGSSRVGLFEVPGVPQPGVTSWGSVGMSFFDNAVTTGDGRSLRVELVTAAGSSWTMAGDAVARCALLVARGESCTPDSVFRDAFAGDPRVTTPHAIFVPPFLWSRFAAQDDEAIVVTWLQAVAVTPEEADFALEQGVDALTRRFEADQPDLYDLARASVGLR